MLRGSHHTSAQRASPVHPPLPDTLKRTILLGESMLNRDHNDATVVREAEEEVDNLLVQFEN